MGDRLRMLRTARGLTQNDVVKIMGEQLDGDKKRQTLGNWETGKSIPRHETLVWLSQFYKVSLDYLIEGKETVHESAEIPVVGTIRTLPVLSAENIIDKIEVPADMVRDGTYFQMIVHEDSMKGMDIRKGRKVLVRQQGTLEDGQVGLVDVGGNVILRKVYTANGGYVLVPANPEYADEKVSASAVTILGRIKVVMFEV